MGKHGVDLAGIRCEIGPRYHIVTVVAGDIFEKTLEVVNSDPQRDGIRRPSGICA